MVCQSCLDNLVKRLLENHSELTPNHALTLATRALARYEKRTKPQRLQKLQFFSLWFRQETNFKSSIFWTFRLHRLIWIGKGYNPDYSQLCTPHGVKNCKSASTPCTSPSQCQDVNNCTCDCPAPTDPNSTYTSNTCSPTIPSCACIARTNCTGGTLPCSCSVVGRCYYTCTPPYVWNGTTCVLPSGVTTKGDGLTWIRA